MGGLSWWHWLIILAAFVIIFGAKKMPDAARGVGRSLRILKSEVSAMHDDEAKAKGAPTETDATASMATPTAQIVGTPTPPSTPTGPPPQTVINGVPVANQLTSRSDFSAQVLHYRLRGADDIHLFHGSVLGYSDQDEQDDAVYGWEHSITANNIFALGKSKYAFANLSQTITWRPGTSGNFKTRDISHAGMVWSGVLGTTGSNGRSKSGDRMALLLSDLLATRAQIQLPATIGGFSVASRTYTIDPDNAMSGFGAQDPSSHRLLTFTLRNGRWSLDTNTSIKEK
jgi:sec-independent protein translocase protein TatA